MASRTESFAWHETDGIGTPNLCRWYWAGPASARRSTLHRELAAVVGTVA
ncbi:hypothetical protein ACH4UM_30630 [Streptomyces sp. NPDC020801]